MKIIKLICVSLFTASVIWAQEALDLEPRSSPTSTPVPSVALTPTPIATPSPTSAEIEAVSPTPAPPPTPPPLSQLDDSFKRRSMGSAADQQRLRVEWRQLQNKVINDADLVATKRAADKAETDLEKRELLRKYYKTYYARIRALASTPEMKQYVNAMEASHVGSTAQPRVRPSASPAGN